jgi:hypothetical protein
MVSRSHVADVPLLSLALSARVFVWCRRIPNCAARIKKQLKILVGDETETQVKGKRCQRAAFPQEAFVEVVRVWPDCSQLHYLRPIDRGYVVNWPLEGEIWKRLFGKVIVSTAKIWLYPVNDWELVPGRLASPFRDGFVGDGSKPESPRTSGECSLLTGYVVLSPRMICRVLLVVRRASTSLCLKRLGLLRAFAHHQVGLPCSLMQGLTQFQIQDVALYVIVAEASCWHNWRWCVFSCRLSILGSHSPMQLRCLKGKRLLMPFEGTWGHGSL